MTMEEIQAVFTNTPFSFPLFEDEVPNTYPIPYIHGWRYVVLEEDSGNDLEREIITALVRKPPVSLYVDIPFCKGKCRFCVYRTIQVKSCKSGAKDLAKTIAGYLKLLGNELDQYKNSGVCFSDVRQLYIGGGSPSMLGIDGVQKLFELLAGHLKLADLRTSCIELEPSSVSKEIVAELQNCGVDRFSLGVQDLDDSVLRSQSRVSKANDIRNALNLLKQAGAYYNVDLIYGLPGQRHEDWLACIDKLAREYAVPEFTLYRVRLGTQSDCVALADTDSLAARVEQKYLFCRASELFAARSDYVRVRPCHWVNKKFLDRWKEHQFAPMSDLRPDAQSQSHPSQLGIGTNAITHADALLVRNRPYATGDPDQGYMTFWNTENGERGQRFAYEAYYRLSEADRSARTVLLRLERDQTIRTGDLPAYCRENFEEFATQKAGDLLYQDANNPQRYVLTEKGLVFYDYIELYLAHQITKNQKRVDFSTPQGETWINDMMKALLPSNNTQVPREQPLVCIEFGAGVGALSIPLISQLHHRKCKTAWYAVDWNPSKLQYYWCAVHKALGIDLVQPIPTRDSICRDSALKIESEHVTVYFINRDIESDLLFLPESDLPPIKEKDHCEFPAVQGVDIFFMPSFLNHITFRSQCIDFAWNRLKPGGCLVLGYPDGAWAPVELGPSAHYDAGQPNEAHAYGKIFREWYREYQQWTGFFSRPIDDWALTLPAADMVKKAYDLAAPDLETVYQILCSRDFSMSSRVLDQLETAQDEKRKFRVRQEFRKIAKDDGWCGASASKMQKFRYIFQLLQKPNAIISSGELP